MCCRCGREPYQRLGDQHAARLLAITAVRGEGIRDIDDDSHRQSAQGERGAQLLHDDRIPELVGAARELLLCHEILQGNFFVDLLEIHLLQCDSKYDVCRDWERARTRKLRATSRIWPRIR